MLLLQMFKFTVIVAFFVVFFIFFGYSTLEKYLKKDIVTVSSTRNNQEGLNFPAVTVCRLGQGTGWRNAPLGQTCKRLKNISD